VLVYLEGEAHPVVVEDESAMPPMDRVVKIVVGSPGRPRPWDPCSWGQLRRALRRVYVREEADRMWRVETHQGLGRGSASISDDVLFPVALLSREHWARVRRLRGWSRREMHVRLARWQREVDQRSTARVPRAEP
jgi:hypothetical protein